MGSTATTRKLLGLLLLILMIINQTMLAPSQDVKKRTSLEDAKENRKKFICEPPQARAYNLRDLMQSYHNIRTREPIYIVLKRCDKYSGCCPGPAVSCTPIELSIYYEEIEVELEMLNIAGKKGFERKWIRVKQHGNCTCKDVDNIDIEQPFVKLL